MRVFTSIQPLKREGLDWKSGPPLKGGSRFFKHTLAKIFTEEGAD